MIYHRKTEPRRYQTKRRRDVARDHRKDKGPTERHPDAPKTRADCKDGPRPCPWVACRYHLFSDVNQYGGVRFAWGEDPGVMATEPHTCALDIADEGAHTLYEVGRIFETTAQDIAHKENGAVRRIRHMFEGYGP